MTRAAAATTPNTHTHTSYTWTKICKQKAIACPSLRFAAHLIFSCHVPPGLNLAQRWKQPGAEVEADARKVLGSHEGHKLFPDDALARLQGTLVRPVPNKRAWHVNWHIPETPVSDARVCGANVSTRLRMCR